MPPSDSNKNPPELRAASTRKRKESSHILENGDPLLPKNRISNAAVKRKLVHHASKDTDMSTHPSRSTRSASVNTEEANLLKDGNSVNPSPMVTAQNLEPASGNDSGVEEVPMEVSDEEPEESAASEMRRISKDWSSTVYAFFKMMPTVEYIDNRRVHIFECNAMHCKGRGKYPRYVRRYLDTGDAKSTSNLRRHAIVCWGKEAVDAASKTKDVHAAREAMTKPRDGSLTAVFESIRKTNHVVRARKRASE
ncbi:hypothetical protein EDB84DRAFT_1621682 [Lactarius hengduanensis]|nr:hypothetical protein EDB84DRAFT_1621682 [Lactarius hengduanensis]